MTNLETDHKCCRCGNPLQSHHAICTGMCQDCEDSGLIKEATPMDKKEARQLVDSAPFVPLRSLGKGSMFRGEGFLKIHGAFDWAPTRHSVFKVLKVNTKSLRVLDVITGRTLRINHWNCQDLSGNVQLYPKKAFKCLTN